MTSRSRPALQGQGQEEHLKISCQGKALERLEAERVDKPRNGPKLNMELEGEAFGGRTLVQMKDICFGYGDQRLLISSPSI